MGLAGCFSNMSYHPYLFGTWVPVVTLGAGVGNTVPVYTTNSGTYTRIGRAVFFNILLSGDGGAEGAGTGQITLTLPFTTAASQLDITLPWGTAMNGAVEHLLFGHLIPSSATMLIARDVVLAATRVEHVAFTGVEQDNASRSIQLQGKFLVQ